MKTRRIALALLVASLVLQTAHAAWDKTKPPTSGALVSADIRANWAEIEKAGNAVTVTRDPALGVWNAGGSAAPSAYALAGTGAAVVRTGTGEADTTRKVGKYAAKVTFGSATATLCQDVWSTTTFDTGLRGRTFSAGLWTQTSTASQVRVQLDDGVGTTNSVYHSGGGAFEWLTLTRTLDASATKLSMCFRVESAGAAYASAYTLVVGALPPDDYRPPIPTYDLATGQMFSSSSYARLTSDFTKNNSTTLSDVTGMSFAVVANADYHFRYFMKIRSMGAAGAKYALTGPAAPTSIIYGVYGANTTGAASATAAFGGAINVTTADVEEPNCVEGFLRNGANAGTVQLQFAQNAADASNSVIRAESFGIVQRMN